MIQDVFVQLSNLQVPLPEKPDTEDETLLKKWRQELRSVRKENRERYSQRCDIELKLVVRSVSLPKEIKAAVCLKELTKKKKTLFME